MKSKTVKDPGLGSKFQKPINRMMNPDGSYNIVRKGGLNNYQDFYKFLLDIKWPLFFVFITIFYVSLNLIFTALYLIIGIDQLRGISSNQSDFFNAFSFSAQTFTTVGYGAISPNGKGVSILAMIEAYAGLLSFALATGLLYGRFSKPSLKIIFSENLLLTPYENGMSFMFKMVNTRNNVLLNTKVTTLFIMDKGIGEEAYNKEYFPLNLESDKVNFFPLTWTLVHKIDENSPAFEISLSELKKRNAEIIIMVETFDETFGQMLIQKHSYAHEKWIEGKKFDRNFRMDEEGKLVLHINELNNLTSI